MDILDENCTFKPTINVKSKSLSRNKSCFIQDTVNSKKNDETSRLAEIFELIDTDADGKISRDAIDLTCLEDSTI